jgi:hypothetical protein
VTRSRASARKASFAKIRLRFLSQLMEVGSDSPEVLKALRFQYRHFLDSDRRTRPARRVSLRLRGSRPSLAVDAKTFSLPDGPLALAQGQALMFESLMDAVQGHLLFHAGVVSRENRGLLVCGPPGFGKTSLVLELVRRGFAFLSDDYAPLSLTTGGIEPFPRSLGIVAASRAPRWIDRMDSSGKILQGNKWLLDPAAIPGLRIAGPCSPEVVLLLGPASSESRRPTRYQISVPPSLEKELRGLLSPLPLARRRAAHHGQSVFRFSLPGGQEWSARLQSWVSSRRSCIYSVDRVYSRAGAFRPPLRVHEVAPRDGIVEMLSDLQNRRPTRHARIDGDSPAVRLLLQAASVLGSRRFYRFEGGGLAARARAAQDLLGDDRSSP